jgi:hypothetical protein
MIGVLLSSTIVYEIFGSSELLPWVEEYMTETILD